MRRVREEAFVFQGVERFSDPTMEMPGEPGRIRTADPLIKSQMLYLLSYRP